jgi:hypothetical protein
MAKEYKNIVVLSNSEAFTTHTVFAIYNPTASPIDASVIGSLMTYQTDAYKAKTDAATISIAAGYTLYGRFTSVSGDGLICLY